jgi:hypothetical protein
MGGGGYLASSVFTCFVAFSSKVKSCAGYLNIEAGAVDYNML